MRGDEGAGQPLAGEVALVTGGSRGIGLAIVRMLIEAGAAVTLVARDQAALDEIAANTHRRAAA